MAGTPFLGHPLDKFKILVRPLEVPLWQDKPRAIRREAKKKIKEKLVLFVHTICKFYVSM